jgi:hypothetical protein
MINVHGASVLGIFDHFTYQTGWALSTDALGTL